MTIHFRTNSYDQPVDFITFPGGEVHVRNIPKCRNSGMDIRGDSDYMIFTAKIENSTDVMVLLMATDAARRQGFQNVSLEMPYVPYARQDRVANPGEAHSLKMFATLINAQKYDEVTVFDPHSDVVEALFDNVKIKTNYEFVTGNLPRKIPFYLVVPDAGAQKKATALCAYLMKDPFGDFNQMEVILANKKRDTKTGQITGFVMDRQDALDPTMPCYIVDDICDGGGTFMGLAKVLKDAGAGDCHLMVSHGIFSNSAIERLTQDYFKTIICAYGWTNVAPECYPNTLKVCYKL